MLSQRLINQYVIVYYTRVRVYIRVLLEKAILGGCLHQSVVLLLTQMDMECEEQPQETPTSHPNQVL